MGPARLNQGEGPGRESEGARRGAVITRPTLRDQIKDALLQRILQGTYEPGERIVEIRVAHEFGVSQAPVREALRELEILRLIESEPFRGARVRRVRPEEIFEIYPVRAALEEVAARAAAPRLAGRVQPLADELQGMRAAAADGDLHRFVAHDVAFHRLFVVASGNRTLIDMWETLHVDLRTRLTLIQRHGDLAEVAEAHVPVMEALHAGDGLLAGRLVAEHIEGFGRSVAEGLAGRSPGGEGSPGPGGEGSPGPGGEGSPGPGGEGSPRPGPEGSSRSGGEGSPRPGPDGSPGPGGEG